MHFYIYSRKSVYTGKGESIENQVELCRDYIRSHFHPVSGEAIAVYEDEGFSGKNLDRPEFQRMMRDMEREKPDCLVCYRLDRISRNVGDFAGLIERLNRRGVDFVCIREKFDTGTPMGKAMMYIASVFAQLERETIAQRVRDNMLLLAKTGRWLGGQTPTGFTSQRVGEVILEGKVRTSCRLLVNEEEMSAVRLMYEKMAQLGSLSAVARYLKTNHLTSRGGGAFSLPGIKEILQNPVYCTADPDSLAYFTQHNAVVCFGQDNFSGGPGLLGYNKRDYTKSHAPRQPMDRWIVAAGRHRGQISGKAWVAVQQQLQAAGGDRPPAAHNDYALLSGFLRCARCQSPMLAKKRSRTPAVFDYICTSKLRGRGCDCPNLNGPEADRLLGEHLSAISRNPSVLAKQLAKQKAEFSLSEDGSRRPGSDAAIHSRRRELDRLSELLTTQELHPALLERLNARAAALDAELTSLLHPRDGPTGEDPAPPPLCWERLCRCLLSFPESFEFASIHEKRALLRLWVSACSWDGSMLRIVSHRS